MRTKFNFFFVFLFPVVVFSQPTVLVDFGANASSNIFGLAGWNTLIKSPSVTYSSAGPGGLIPNPGGSEFADYQGVQGTTRNFQMGERIVVTWYNNSDETYRITARISFEDFDEPDIDGSEGKWYTMRSFEDYRYTYSVITPHSTRKTVFNITDSGVHKTDGPHSVVNVNLSIEWFDTVPKQFILCDKIELYYDADITPPNAPTSLSASVLSDTKIGLNWTAPSDNVGVVEYLVYNGNQVEGYTRTNSYTAYYLEPSTSYAFKVTALDYCGNESNYSNSVSATTAAFNHGTNLFNPKGFEYKGAFAFPELFSYGGDAIAYNPNGDGGQSGGGSADGYPGSLFISDLNIPERGFAAEVNIPVPIISPTHNLSELNQVTVLQSPVNIRPTNVNDWPFVDLWRSGFEYVISEDRLYSSWGIYYTVTGEKHASISFCNPNNLSGSVKYGAWFIGADTLHPNNQYLGDYLFQLPQIWADLNVFGRSMVNGRYREGGLSGLGPTLYSFNPIGTGVPPPPLAVLPFSTLLEYGPVEGTDDYNFPNSIDDYNHSDLWRDADWVSANGGSAVMIIGNKAHGNNWYGYTGEEMRHDWVICDLPYPEFFNTDPDGKGWRAHNYIPMGIFYKPTLLADVANGIISSYVPQPYMAIRFNPDVFWGMNKEICSAVFDTLKKRLYVTEFNAPSDGRLLVHVFDYDSALVNVAQEEIILPIKVELFQNYPNPFNPITTIKFSIPHTAFITLTVYDVLGREIAILVDEQKSPGDYEVEFNAGGLSSGIYIYELNAGKFNSRKKLLILK